MNRRTSLAALLVAVALAVPAAPASAAQNLLVVKGAGAGSATLTVKRTLYVDLESMRSEGCGPYAGLTFHDHGVTVLRVAAIDAVAGQVATPPPPVVFGWVGDGALILRPGAYRVDLHADRACRVAFTAGGLRAPWVNTARPGAKETFAAEDVDPVGPVTAGSARWQLPASAARATTIVVTAGVRQSVGGHSVGDVDACAGPAPHACWSPADQVYTVSFSTESGLAGTLVAALYEPGDLADLPQMWASGRLAGPYVDGAVAMLTTG